MSRLFFSETGRALIQNNEEITMFDGVGIGIQDTTVVRTIYDRAVELGLGARISFS